MLLRYYRYILILKLLCLLGAIYYFTHDWYSPYQKGGTTIIAHTQSGISMERLTAILHNTPLPRSVLSQQKNGIALHVPWTNNTQYVLGYLGAPLQDLKTSVDTSVYTKACKKRIVILPDSIYEESCYYTPYKNLLVLLSILFVLLV